MNQMQDLFISHASKDKAKYIFPLVSAFSAKGVTYWLDALEVGWGGSVVGAINDGLSTSRRVLLCLSENFLERPWARAEMESALARQIDTDEERVLPLILNSTEKVLAAYPLLRTLSYRLFDQGIESIAAELAALFGSESAAPGGLHIRIQSAHSGLLCDVVESPNVSVEWLASKGKAALGGEDMADAGVFNLLPIRWILVDVKAENDWRELSESERRDIRALIKVGEEVRTATEGTTSLGELGVQDGTVFHLYGIGVGHIVAMGPQTKSPGNIQEF
jgi:hypothetical protein